LFASEDHFGPFKREFEHCSIAHFVDRRHWLQFRFWARQIVPMVRLSFRAAAVEKIIRCAGAALQLKS